LRASAWDERIQTGGGVKWSIGTPRASISRNVQSVERLRGAIGELEQRE
jgi:hypothetical protein